MSALTPLPIPVSVVWTVVASGQPNTVTPADPVEVAVAQVHLGLRGETGLRGVEGVGLKGDKGDKGDTGDVTPEAEKARDEAQTARSAAADSADIAANQAAFATTSKTQAEAARDAAFVNANVYASTAAGLAAVADGMQFQVVSADGLSIQRWRRDAGPVAVVVARYPSATASMALKIQAEEAAALAARAATVRHAMHGQRPTGSKISWRVHPREKTPPAHWTWANHSVGRRFAWGADGNLYEVPSGVLRHTYESRFLGGQGRYLGAWLNEPYSQNKCSAAAFSGGVAGSPGTLPTGVSEVSGSAGLTRTVSVGSEAGVNYLQLRYAGTASAGSFDLDLGVAISSYLNASDAGVAVAAGQAWTFSAYAKTVGASVGLVSLFPYVKQDGSAVSTGSHTIPLQDVYHPWFSVRILTAGAADVRGGIRVVVTSGSDIDFSVRIILPQLEPRSGMTSPVPVVDGQRYTEIVSLPRNSAAFIDRWGSSKSATLFTEFIRPYWDFGTGRIAWITDTSSGGRLSVGEAADNNLGTPGVQWTGSASVTIGALGLYFDLPGSITRMAASASATDLIGCRDNYEPRTAAGTVFNGYQPGGLSIGDAGSPRSTIFREVAAWDFAMPADGLRALTENFENANYVDAFQRQNSVAGALGTTEAGSLPWLSYGFNPVYSEAGRPAKVSGGELSVGFNDPAGGEVVIATYSRLALPSFVRRMGAAVIWRDRPDQTVEIASITLISTADARERIAAITGSESGPGSVHNVWLINAADVGTYKFGTTETDQGFGFTKRAYGVPQWIGHTFWGGRTFISLPDGQFVEPAESAEMWALRGRYCTWEHYRHGIAGAISNEVQILAVCAD